jgi:hypothetical protein
MHKNKKQTWVVGVTPEKQGGNGQSEKHFIPHLPAGARALT